MVFFSRLRENKNPLLHGGKDHLSHRLLTLGMNDREAVMYLYLIAIIYGIGALFLTRASFELAIMILAGALFLSLFIWVKLWGRKGL
jgi:UDP-GlcNAc:undecaprenyl-phosphate GlcNAc-1-phosphate transferase